MTETTTPNNNDADDKIIPPFDFRDGLEDHTPTQSASPLCSLDLDPVETLTAYQALRWYLRAQAAQEADNLDTMQTTIAILRAIRPAAEAAAKLFTPASTA